MCPVHLDSIEARAGEEVSRATQRGSTSRERSAARHRREMRDNMKQQACVDEQMRVLIRWVTDRGGTGQQFLVF